MWDQNDLNGYNICKKQNIGQINDDFLGIIIKHLASKQENKTFLEIGTWNGLGSTKCFVETLLKRNDNWVFYSLENNKDKAYDAAELYKDFNRVHILNEVIWNEEPEDLRIVFPELKSNDTYKMWHHIDLENMKLCPKFLDRQNLPEMFDVILFDGGEFTTYYEFQILQKYAKIVLLDDVNSNKCAKIAEEIRSKPSTWKIIIDSSERQGIMVAQKI